MTQVLFHPSAVEEARAAHRWYAERSKHAAAAFLSELDTAIAEIAESPDRWPAYFAGTRRYLLRRFPFLVVYRQQDSAIQVIAVAHGHRRPAYWKHR